MKASLLPTVFLFAALAACSSKKSTQVGNETDHRLVLPASAKNIQNRGDSTSWRADKGIATLLEIDRVDLGAFEAQLKVADRRAPAKGHGDPLVNGWNVWPQDAKSFVPGNEVYGGFKKTWTTAAVPEEMLSCQSTAGDRLHVEVWDLQENRVLLKLFTDWN